MYMNYRELDADIIIVGAGIAGLSAGHYLLEKDPHSDFLILDVEEKSSSFRGESSLWNMKWTENRGKTTNTAFADDKLDNFINSHFVSIKQKYLTNLLNKLNIRIIKNENRGKLIVDSNEIHEILGKENMFNFLSHQEEQMLKAFCYKIDDLSKKVSFEDPRKNIEMVQYDQMNMEVFLNKLISKKIVRDVVSQTFLLNTVSGLQPKDVSALFFLAYCNSTDGIRNQFCSNIEGIYGFFIEGGAENLRFKIMEEIGKDSIVSVSEISEVTADNYCVGIKTPEEYFFARIIIYTISEAEINKIIFTPPLPDEKIVISNNLVKGTLKKFALIYENPFWNEKDLSGEVYIMNTESKNGPIQICLNASNAEEEIYVLTGLADQECEKNDILKQLGLYFGIKALYPITFLENSSSFLELGFLQGSVSMNCFKDIQQYYNRVVWASPETAKNWYGTIAGSVEAGYKGAIGVLNDGKPNMLSFTELQLISPDEVIILPRRLGILGVKWHIILPTLLLALFLIVQLKNRLSRKNLSSN